jgi:hypothetical protein
MWNPLKWLWTLWHGEDTHPAPIPEQPVEKWPLIEIHYELFIAPQRVEESSNQPPQTEDEFADLCKLPIQADSLL